MWKRSDCKVCAFHCKIVKYLFLVNEIKLVKKLGLGVSYSGMQVGIKLVKKLGLGVSY